MKTIIAPVQIETRGKKCGRCRFRKVVDGYELRCILFQLKLDNDYNSKTGYVSADRLLQCLACDEARGVVET